MVLAIDLKDAATYGAVIALTAALWIAFVVFQKLIKGGTPSVLQPAIVIGVLAFLSGAALMVWKRPPDAAHVAWTSWSAAHCRVTGSIIKAGTKDDVGMGLTLNGQPSVVLMPGTSDQELVNYRCDDNVVYQTPLRHVPEAFERKHADLIAKASATATR